MSRHPDFFMHYEDNSYPLNDIFTDSDNHDWTAKAPEMPVTKTEGTKDVISTTASLIDIHLLDDAARHSLQSARTLMGHSSMFNAFSRDQNELRAMTDTNQESSLCVDSDQLTADEVSEQTGFSGYFSETRAEKNSLSPSASGVEAEIEKLVPPGVTIHNTRADDSNTLPKLIYKDHSVRREVQKPPTTAGIKLDHLKAVFHLERPKAEKKLGLKRTTFSNLSRHYGISKWPFRTIRDSLNRMEANKRLLDNASVSKDRRRKLQRQQKHLHDVIDLIYKDPQHSRDSNTLAVLLVMVASKGNQ